MRKLWICLLSVAVLLCGVIPAAAVDQDFLRNQIIESYDSEEVNDLEVLGVMKQDSLASVDISQWRITEEELKQVHDELYLGGELPWFARRNYAYQHIDSGIVSFTPMVLDAQVYDRELYEQKIAELMAEAYLPGMTDWQMALSVHDYIVLHTVYDETYEKDTGYDALVNGTTVCNGYATLYMDVMNRLGIPCQMVICEDTGDGNGHGWNLLQLQGQWYHVDLTWDDPVQDIYGRVDHDYFLKTDEEFKNAEEPHDFAWQALEQTPSEPYIWDDFLEDSVSSVCFVSPVTAVYRTEEEITNRITAMDLTTGETWTLYEYDRMEVELGDGVYLRPTVGLCFWNGRIYFNREDRVLSMLPDGSDLREVYYRPTGDKYVIGCLADDGILYLSLLDQDGNVSNTEVEMEDVSFHTHNYETHMVEATCGEAGFTEQVCSCGIAYNLKELLATDHSWNYEVTKEPTREESGQLRVRCELYGQEEWEELSPLPSTLEVVLETWTDYLPVLAGVILTLLIVVTLIRKKRR